MASLQVGVASLQVGVATEAHLVLLFHPYSVCQGVIRQKCVAVECATIGDNG